MLLHHEYPPHRGPRPVDAGFIQSVGPCVAITAKGGESLEPQSRFLGIRGRCLEDTADTGHHGFCAHSIHSKPALKHGKRVAGVRTPTEARVGSPAQEGHAALCWQGILEDADPAHVLALSTGAALSCP